MGAHQSKPDGKGDEKFMVAVGIQTEQQRMEAEQRKIEASEQKLIFTAIDTLNVDEFRNMPEIIKKYPIYIFERILDDLPFNKYSVLKKKEMLLFMIVDLELSCIIPYIKHTDRKNLGRGQFYITVEYGPRADMLNEYIISISKLDWILDRFNKYSELRPNIIKDVISTDRLDVLSKLERKDYIHEVKYVKTVDTANFFIQRGCRMNDDSGYGSNANFKMCGECHSAYFGNWKDHAKTHKQYESVSCVEPSAPKKENDTCVICMRAARNAAMLCGHYSSCFECLSKCSNCPICRKSGIIIKIYA